MTFSLNLNARLERHGDILVVSHAFQVDGEDYDIEIEEEGIPLGRGDWNDRFLVQKAQAVWAEVMRGLKPPAHFDEIELKLDLAKDKTEVKIVGEGTTPQIQDGTRVALDADRFIQEAAVDPGLKSRYTPFTAHTMMHFVHDYLLKPHNVAMKVFANNMVDLAPTKPLRMHAKRRPAVDAPLPPPPLKRSHSAPPEVDPAAVPPPAPTPPGPGQGSGPDSSAPPDAAPTAVVSPMPDLLRLPEEGDFSLGALEYAAQVAGQATAALLSSKKT